MNLRAWMTSATMLVGVVLVAVAYSWLTRAQDPDIEGMVKKDYDGFAHVDAGDDVEYDETPPMGGEHDPRVLTCGVYDRPVRDELAVHAVEHGAIWLTYDPALSATQVAELVDAAPDKSVVSPYPGLPSPVVATAWNRQVQLTGVDDPRLEQFVDGFEDGHTAPEPRATCENGVVEYADEDEDEG